MLMLSLVPVSSSSTGDEAAVPIVQPELVLHLDFMCMNGVPPGSEVESPWDEIDEWLNRNENANVAFSESVVELTPDRALIVEDAQGNAVRPFTLKSLSNKNLIRFNVAVPLPESESDATVAYELKFSSQISPFEYSYLRSISTSGLALFAMSSSAFPIESDKRKVYIVDYNGYLDAYDTSSEPYTCTWRLIVEIQIVDSGLGDQKILKVTFPDSIAFESP